MKTLLNTHALADALTAFEDSLTPNEESLAPDEVGGANAAAACYRQPEKKAYFAVDLAAITELGSREPAQAFSQQFAASLANLLQDPDAAIQASEIIKHDRTTTVAKITVNGIALVIKRYNRKSLLHGFTRLWRTTRARRSFDAARWLLQNGILTAMPLAFIENRSFGALNHGAYYLSLCHPGDNLLRQLQTGDINQHDFPALLAEFDRLFALLRRANAAHGDMKISNFIYQSNRLCVLDLDAMQPYKRAWQAKRAYRKDVERFRRNWAGSEFEGAVEAFLDNV
jgi:hypothetical protein